MDLGERGRRYTGLLNDLLCPKEGFYIVRVQFEEKTYESYFNNELDQMSSIYFPPGQVLEGLLGFDVSARTASRKLWKILGYPFWFFHPFQGANLQEVAKELDGIIGHIVDSIPGIKANLFIQYKRPEYITTANGKEWIHWNQEYFRYSIYSQQQKLLERIDSSFGDRALVIYAAPAISSLNELVQCKKNKKIIESSNFKKVGNLVGHSRNTYIKSGTYSVACSEPERIENINILSEIERFKQAETAEVREVIGNTSKSIEEALEITAYYKAAFNSLMEEYRELKQFKILYSHLVMKCFREVTGVQWLISI